MPKIREEEALRTNIGNRFIVRGLAALAGLSLASLTACKSSGVERSEATQTTITSFRADLDSYNKNLDATLGSLDELVKSGKTDPKSAFAKFSGNLGLLFKSADSAKSNAEAMKSRGDAYFGEWEKSAAAITNEDIRKIADQRRAELQKEYKELVTQMQNVAADAKPLREQLQSLHDYYSQDLTEKGIDLSKPLVGNVKSAASKVQKGIKSVQEEVDKVAAELKVATPPPPPPANAPEKK